MGSQVRPPPRRQAKEPESITKSRSGRDRGAFPERAASEPRESQKAPRREPRASRERAKRLPGASRERAKRAFPERAGKEPGDKREKVPSPPPASRKRARASLNQGRGVIGEPSQREPRESQKASRREPRASQKASRSEPRASREKAKRDFPERAGKEPGDKRELLYQYFAALCYYFTSTLLLLY